MSNKYIGMSHDDLVSEKKRLHKKLIFPNIVIVIIAIVACIAQILMPFFKITVKLNGDVVASAVEVLYEDYGDDECLMEDSDDSIISSLLTKNNIKKMTSNLNSNITIELTATELYSLAFASDDAAEDEVISLLAGIIKKMNITDELENVLEAMMPSVISTVVAETITSTLTESLTTESGETVELTEEQTQVINSAATSIEIYIQKLSEASTVDEVKEEVLEGVTETVTTAMQELDLSDEDIETVNDFIEEYFDEILSYATDEDGQFSYTELLNNVDDLIAMFTDSSSSDDNTDDGGGTELTDEEIAAALDNVPSSIKTYILSTLTADELAAMTEAEQNRYIYEYYMEYYPSSSSANETKVIGYTLTADTGNTDNTEEGTASVITKYINYLNDEDYEGLINEILGDEGFDDSTLQTIKLGALAMFAVVMVIAALWAILAILAILHILLPNKKVGMWYVKLFGGLTAIIFYLVPVLLIMLKGVLAPTFASMFGISEGLITTILSALAFGGSGLVVIICLAALWLVSIFWCHPIKRKIKKCKKALKKA